MLFPSIYGPPYPTFQFHFILLLFDVLLYLFLMGGMSCLGILYHNKGWHTHSYWSCWILLVDWHRRDTSGELSHLWILSWGYMNYISFGSFRLGLWHRADILWWVFGYYLLSSNPGFLEPMLWVVVRMEVVSQTNHFFLICIHISTNGFCLML